MSFSVMLEKMEAFDPSFPVKKCAETFEKITCDSDILPQVTAEVLNAFAIDTHELLSYGR